MRRISVLLTTLTVMGWAATALAAPLDLKDVPADAKWVAHVDFDAAHASTVVQKFWQQCAQSLPGLKQRLQKVGHHLGLERCKDLHGITLYGTELKLHSGVAVARANWNAKALQEKLEKAPDHKTVDYGKYKIHTWTAHREYKHSHQMAGILRTPDVLVLASSPERLKSALNVLDGKATSLWGKKSPLAEKSPQGTFVLARAVDLRDSRAARKHPALELIRSFTYEKGEYAGRWSGNLAITADSKPVAEKVVKVSEGYVAWLALHGHGSQWFVDVLDKVKFNAKDNVASVTFQDSAEDLAAHMPDLCESIQEHLKMHLRLTKRHCDLRQKAHKEKEGGQKPGKKTSAKCGAAQVPTHPATTGAEKKDCHATK